MLLAQLNINFVLSAQLNINSILLARLNINSIHRALGYGGQMEGWGAPE